MQQKTIYAILADEGKLVSFLQMHGVLGKPPACPNCNKPCKLYTDKYRYRCTNLLTLGGANKVKKQKRVCSFEVGAKKGTFFEKANLPLETICEFVFVWLAHKPKQEWMESEFGMSSKTVVDWANFCREVCLVSLIDTSEKIGGPGKIVEIDECKMGKRKYNRGRIIDGQWIFRGIAQDKAPIFRSRCGTDKRPFARRNQRMDTAGYDDYVRLLESL